jgi:hypothetical protein
MKKPKKLFSDQLRTTIDTCGMSRYAICKATGIPEPSMSRFMSGKTGLSMASVDLICETIGARLVLDNQPNETKTRKGK